MARKAGQTRKWLWASDVAGTVLQCGVVVLLSVPVWFGLERFAGKIALDPHHVVGVSSTLQVKSHLVPIMSSVFRVVM